MSRDKLRLTGLLLSLFSIFVLGTATGQVSPNLFSLSAAGGVVSRQPWPVVAFSSFRVVGNGSSWCEINTASGTYDWSNLDLWLAAAQTHGQNILYTFLCTPQWASSKPNDTSCKEGPGTCDPPFDLNADGTGTDQTWKDFVTALVQHSVQSSTGHLSYYEIWNEPHNNFFWNGTYAQLVRMASDAYSIIKTNDPSGQVLSPTLGWDTTAQSTEWASGYLAAGGNKYIDAVAIHGYVIEKSWPSGTRSDNPETLVPLVSAYKTMLSTYGLGSKQIFDTESSWSVNDQWGPYSTDLDMRAAFLSRSYILHAAYGFSRLYWFQWNDPSDGTLWLPDPNDPPAPGTLYPAGIAYQQTYNWLVGRNISNGCSQNGTVWVCAISGSGGYIAEAVWDTAQSCNNGTCTYSSYKVGTPFTQYQTIYGQTNPITGGTVPIGAKPILLGN